jgi:hypothetical protein
MAGANVTEPVPTTIVETLSGFPTVGVSEVIVPLITIDGLGYPNISLLSRAQLDADSKHIYAIVTGTNTKTNLERDHKATLVVFTAEAVHYCKLDAINFKTTDSQLCTTFSVSSTKADSTGSVLIESPRFIPTESIESLENWDDCRQLLLELKVAENQAHKVNS